MDKNLRTLTVLVNKILNRNEQPTLVTIENCAELLAMSTTSFRRKLAQENSSFKLIQQKYLNELCINDLLNNDIKIESLANKLGYSERATFERSFKNKYGVTPIQFRELKLSSNKEHAESCITAIVKALPVLSSTTQQLLKAKSLDNLDIYATVKIVASDPLLSARIIGVASTAIYGKTPKNLQEAISRNLGINTVINIAVLHSVETSIGLQIDNGLLTKILNTCAIAPQLLRVFKKSTKLQSMLKNQLTEQVLMFGLLGLFVLCHKKNTVHNLAMQLVSGVDDLTSLNIHLFKSVGHTLYSASAMMLSLWHLDASVIKSLNQLNLMTLTSRKIDKDNKLLLFMLECLFQTLKDDKNLDVLEQKAELLDITNFNEIKQLL